MDSEVAFKASLDLKDFRTNLDKEEEINKDLETYLMSSRNSLEDRKAKDHVEREEVRASNKARISS